MLAELEELEQEELDNTLLDIAPENVSLPSVPSTSLPSQPGNAVSVSNNILGAIAKLTIYSINTCTPACAVIQSINPVAAEQCIKSYGYRSKALVRTAELENMIKYFRNGSSAVSRVDTEWCEKQTNSVQSVAVLRAETPSC